MTTIKKPQHIWCLLSNILFKKLHKNCENVIMEAYEVDGNVFLIDDKW